MNCYFNAKHSLIVIITLVICSNSYSQGLIDGFHPTPKEHTIATSFSYQHANEYYLANDELNLGLRQSSVSVFYKYDFNQRFGVVVNLPLVNFRPQDGSTAIYYTSSGEMLKNLMVTGKLGVGVTHPISNYNTESSSAIGQQARSFMIRIVSQITYKNRVFLNLRYGGNLVADPTPDYSVASAKIGFMKNKWYLDFWHEAIMAQGGKDYRGAGELAPENFRELGASSSKIGGTIYHQTAEKRGFFINWSHNYNGRNTYAITSISAGAVWKLTR